MFSLVCTGRKMWSCPLICYWTSDFHKIHTKAVFLQGNQSSDEAAHPGHSQMAEVWLNKTKWCFWESFFLWSISQVPKSHLCNILMLRHKRILREGFMPPITDPLRPKLVQNIWKGHNFIIRKLSQPWSKEFLVASKAAISFQTPVMSLSCFCVRSHSGCCPREDNWQHRASHSSKLSH